jgi:branched-chain amino acid transport system substrate-binding protein
MDRMKKFWMFIVLLSFLTISFTGNALAEKMFKVGVMGPFTGPNAKTGEEIKNSAILAFEDIGYKIGDYSVELVWIDSQSDPAKATNAYAEAVERKGIDAGIFNWHSSVAVAVMELAAQYKVPHLFSVGSSSVVNEKYLSDPEKYSGYWLKGWAVPEKVSYGYIEFLEDAIAKGTFKPENKKVVMFGEDTDYGRDMVKYGKKMFAENGWEIVSEEFISSSQTDFYPLLTKWQGLNPSVIYGTISFPPVISALIKQTREVGMKAQIICDGLGWTGEWYSLTGASSDYIVDMIPQLIKPEAKAWAERYEKKFGNKPSPSSGGLAFDCTRMFIKVAQTALDKEGVLNSESIRNVVIDELLTGKLTYTASDGAITVNRFRYTPDSIPDPAFGPDDWFLPVIQYKGGQGKVIFPTDWAEAEFHPVQ